jgi:hypothetical protein
MGFGGAIAVEIRLVEILIGTASVIKRKGKGGGG